MESSKSHIPPLPKDIMKNIFKINWDVSRDEMIENKKKHDKFIGNFNMCVRGLKYDLLAEQGVFQEYPDDNVNDIMDEEQHDIMNICGPGCIAGNLYYFEDEWCK